MNEEKLDRYRTVIITDIKTYIYKDLICFKIFGEDFSIGIPSDRIREFISLFNETGIMDDRENVILEDIKGKEIQLITDYTGVNLYGCRSILNINHTYFRHISDFW